MSNEGDPEEQASTTTLSTVAIQSGDTQIIVAVLKCGKLLQLHLTDAQPDLLEIGNNQEESKKLLEEHDQLLIKLKRNEGGVQMLLDEADKIAEGKNGEENVYEQMALSLSEAWKTLVKHLEKRRSLLQLASHFYDHALEFAIKIDEADELQGDELNGSVCLTEFKQKYSIVKKGLLVKSLLALNKSNELLEFLKSFEAEEALRFGSGGRCARDSCRKVEGLMELLQDRRREIDQCVARQICDVDVDNRISEWERQEQTVTHWFKENADPFLENNQLGSSLSESEDLLKQYKEFELKAKNWGLLVERLLQQESELQALSEKIKLQVIVEKSQNLRTMHEKFMDLMSSRQGELYESNAFFSSANKAFEALAAIESTIKHLKMKTVHLPDLAKKHEELHHSIEDAAADALQRGQLILQKLSPDSAQVTGVQRMLGFIGERVEGLSQQCQAYKDLVGKKRQLLTYLDDLEEKVTDWIKSCNSVLSSRTDPGSSLSEAEQVLNKHIELSTQTQHVVKQSEAAEGLIKELGNLESSEAVEISSRSSVLREQLKALQRNISARLESIRSYVLFLSSAEEVEDQIKTLLVCYRKKPEAEEVNEDPAAEDLDAGWQSFLQKFLSMQDHGNNFINSSNMVSNTRVSNSLNVKGAVMVVEKSMENLNKKKAEISDLWTSWQLHYTQIKSVKKQWKKIKDQFKKVVHDLKSLDGVLVPVSKVDLGNDFQTVSKLQDNFSSIKPQFLQLNAEVEFLVNSSELLALKGIPTKERNERVSELLQVHQRVRDKIREYETLLSMVIKFHHIYQELDSLMKVETVKGTSDPTQARIQLSQHQERQNHIKHLYKLVVSLATDITGTIQQMPMLAFSVQEKIERLQQGSASWATRASRCEEDLLNNIHYCVFKEEISELKESFKDLKKKFNNLKFNYMKKNEKLRNLKAVRNQLQQIEIYTEKLQVLKKKLQAFTLKVSNSSEKHLLGSNPRDLEDVVNELHRQVGDFDRAVEDYKHNLDLSMKLQQAVEEYEFWCDEASATIVRVGKYSSECKTKEAISSLYKQFEKFVWPTIPQQEDRISQITELAVRLHGAEEGKKYIEKTITKHSEIVDSIKELSSGLLDLEAKLQEELLKSQSAENKHDTIETPEAKETGHTPEITGPGGTKEDTVTKKTEIKKPSLRKSRSQDQPDQPRVHSETYSYTQEAYSKTSTVHTSSKSTVETKEKTHTSYSHTHTFSMSNSPVEKDRRTYTLQQTKRPSQETPPPAQGECHTVPIYRAHREKPQVGGGLHAGPQALHTEMKSEGHFSEESFSHGAPDSGFPPDTDFHPDHLSEESLSNDEYECTSPDDISLPPLSETPESNMVQSENDLDDGYCVSSHSHHTSHYTQQCHSRQGEPLNYQAGESLSSPTAGLPNRFKAESCSFVHSPLTVPTPTLVSSTISSILKSSKPKGPSECQQTTNYVHESRVEKQACVHEPAPVRHSSIAKAGNVHATIKPLTSEQDPDLCKPTAIREEIKRSSSAMAGQNLAQGQGPNFSKSLSNAVVMEGSPVTLEVEVTGFPEPALTWFKNGQELHSDRRMSLTQKEGKHVLFIKRTVQTDSGQYLVRASNLSGTVSSSSVLQVKEPSLVPSSQSRCKPEGASLLSSSPPTTHQL